jgi:hypothetical protein
MRIARFVVVVVLTAGLVVLSSFAGSIAAKQKGKGKGGPGGFGGFGFTNVPARVLDNKALQEELKVTAEQKEKFKPVADKAAALQKKQAEMFAGGKGGFDKEKFQEIGKEAQAVAEETRKALEETLNADQKKRVKQIEVQAAGPNAFVNEETAKELKLTEAQTTKVKGIVDEFRKDSREARAELFQGGADAEKVAEVNKKVDKLQAAALKEIQDALTDEQKKTWKTIVGEPFDVSKLRPQFRKID